MGKFGRGGSRRLGEERGRTGERPVLEGWGRVVFARRARAEGTPLCTGSAESDLDDSGGTVRILLGLLKSGKTGSKTNCAIAW